MRKIPKKIKKLYVNFGLRVNLYVSLRWKLCPFEKIESYLPKSGLIFDLGCGYGLLSNFLVFSSFQRRVIGVDYSLKRLAIAKKTNKKENNIKFIRKKIHNFNLSTCHGIVMSDFLHHLPLEVSRELLERAFKALDDNGKLIIQDVDRKPYWKYLITFIIDRLLNPFDRLYYQPAIYWEDLLKEIGFRVKTISVHKDLPLADIIFVCSK